MPNGLEAFREHRGPIYFRIQERKNIQGAVKKVIICRFVPAKIHITVLHVIRDSQIQMSVRNRLFGSSRNAPHVIGSRDRFAVAFDVSNTLSVADEVTICYEH